MSGIEREKDHNRQVLYAVYSQFKLKLQLSNGQCPAMSGIEREKDHNRQVFSVQSV